MTRQTMIAAAAALGAAAGLWWLTRRGSVVVGANVVLANGNIAIYETGADALGGQVAGRYLGCLGEDGSDLPDSECEAVFREYPQIRRR